MAVYEVCWGRGQKPSMHTMRKSAGREVDGRRERSEECAKRRVKECRAFRHTRPARGQPVAVHLGCRGIIITLYIRPTRCIYVSTSLVND